MQLHMLCCKLIKLGLRILVEGIRLVVENMPVQSLISLFSISC